MFVLDVAKMESGAVFAHLPSAAVVTLSETLTPFTLSDPLV